MPTISKVAAVLALALLPGTDATSFRLKGTSSLRGASASRQLAEPAKLDGLLSAISGFGSLIKPKTNQCTNDADKALWAGAEHGEATFGSTLRQLRLKCTQKTSTSRCVSRRFQFKEGYTADCSECMGALAQCVNMQCTVQCIGLDNEGCNKCMTEACSPAFTKCAGFSQNDYGDGTASKSETLFNAGSALLKYNGIDIQNKDGTPTPSAVLFNIGSDLFKRAYNSNGTTNSGTAISNQKTQNSTTSSEIYDLFKKSIGANSTASLNKGEDSSTVSDLYNLYENAYGTGNEDNDNTEKEDKTSSASSLLSLYNTGSSYFWGSSKTQP